LKTVTCYQISHATQNFYLLEHLTTFVIQLKSNWTQCISESSWNLYRLGRKCMCHPVYNNVTPVAYRTHERLIHCKRWSYQSNCLETQFAALVCSSLG